MKKFYLFLAPIVSLSLSAQQLYEPFSGTGALTSNGWTKHSGSSTGNSILLTETSGDYGNSLSYSGLAASSGNRISITAGDSEDVNKALPSSLSAVVYYSLLVKVPNTDGLSSDGDFSVSLAQNAGSSGVTTFRAKLYFKAGSASNTYNVGIENSTGTPTPSFINSNLPVNTTILVVVKHEISTNTSSLWLNPVPGSSETSPDVTNSSGSTTTTSIASICIRQNGNASSGTGNIEFDEIRVSDQWEEVLPASDNMGTENINTSKNKPVLSHTLIHEQVYVLLDGTSKVEFYTINGSLAKSVTTQPDRPINTQDLQNGIYFVRVINKNKTETIKIIKK